MCYRYQGWESEATNISRGRRKDSPKRRRQSAEWTREYGRYMLNSNGKGDANEVFGNLRYLPRHTAIRVDLDAAWTLIYVRHTELYNNLDRLSNTVQAKATELQQSKVVL